MMTDEERHQSHHEALARIQAKIDRIRQSAYENAKKHRNPAPRKFAQRSIHSQLVSQAAAWRSHLYGFHGVPTYGPRSLSPFISLEEMKKMHEEFHAQEKSS